MARNIDPARWCPDCKRAFQRRVGVDVYVADGRPDSRRQARCRRCTLVYKRVWAKSQERLAKANAPLKPGQRCPCCEGLAHRRPLDGCPRCKLAHVPLPPVEPVLRKFDWAV